MADAKITQLDAITAPVAADLMEIVVNVSTVPASKKVLISDLALSIASLIGISDGWISAGETWTYVSATSFTVPTDLTAKYTIGLKIRLVNGTTKYFYVKSSTYAAPNTTVNLVANNDYALAAGAISSNYISRAEFPLGFPGWFNWTPGFTGFSVVPTVGKAIFQISGFDCHVHLLTSVAGTSNATSFTITGFPVPARSGVTANGIINGYSNNNGAPLTTPGRIALTTTTLTLQTDMASGAWVNTGNKYANFDFIYPI